MSGFLYYLTSELLNVETEFRIILELKATFSLSIRKSNLKLLLDLFSKMISYFNTTSESVSVVGVSLTNLILTYK